MPMAIIGSMDGEKPNFMAAGWNTRANANPPMLAVGIHKSHLTHDCIMEKKSFSFNIPGENLLQQTDFVGLVSGRSHDKSKIFKVFYGENEHAPLISDAALCLECTLINTVMLPSNTLFIGEITAAWCHDKFLTEKDIPDFQKIQCYYLTMPDNTYWGMGKPLGKAWSVGKELK